MIKVKPLFSGFKKPGEEVSEKEGIYRLKGKGTDLGCTLELQEEIKNPSLLELEIKASIKKEEPWSRLRIEIYDKDRPQEPATSFVNEYLPLDLDGRHFRRLSFPILGIVKVPVKVQFMVVGPAESCLEIKNVSIR